MVINTVPIYISNVITMLLLFTIVIGNTWRFRDKGKENRILRLMIILVASCIVMDPMAFALDGKEGLFITILIYLCNSWLFASNMICLLLWVMMAGEHLIGGLSRKHFTVIASITAAGVLLLIVNVFVPVVFTVEENVYCRAMLYWLYVAIDVALLIDSVVMFFMAKYRGGFLIFFPIWAFIVPLIVGMVIQSMFYGISIVWPCAAVAIAGVFTSLQNEVMFRDNLTETYNRAYLDFIGKKLIQFNDRNVTIVMIDMNRFKEINDTYGHSVGDEALHNAAAIFKRAVGDMGIVIRCAGDEFIGILNTYEDNVINGVISDIRRRTDEFNKHNRKDYRLYTAIGYSKLDLEKETIDQTMKKVDARMYADKKAFYENNAGNDRRHGKA